MYLDLGLEPRNTEALHDFDVGPGAGDFAISNPPWLCGTVTAPGAGPPIHTKGYVCPTDQGQYCDAIVGNPDYGFTGFDNLGQASLLMIQVRNFASLIA